MTRFFGVYPLRAAAVFAACLLAATLPLRAQGIDFGAAAYVPGKTFWGVDSWVSMGTVEPKPDNFVILSVVGDKWARCLSSSDAILSRDFPAVGGFLNLSWRWRSSNPTTRFCVGAARSGLAPGNQPSALACMEPDGTLGIQGNSAASSMSRPWVSGKWQYMRLHLDASRNTFSLFAASDSLRSDEGVSLFNGVMADPSGPLTRLVLRTQDGAGWVEIDDLRWEPITYWVGSQTDTLWSTASNWNPARVPDSNSHVIFDGSAIRGIAVDKNQAIGSLNVALAFRQYFNLKASTLSVSRNATLAGGLFDFATGGRLVLSGPRGQRLTGGAPSPLNVHLVHDGAGTLRFDAPLPGTASFTQSRGALDFNGANPTVSGDFTVRNGRPGTLINLHGRTLTAGNSARFEGVSKDTLLGLDPMGEVPWTATVLSGKSLTADLALIGMAVAGDAKGYATRSVDASGNQGWNFVTGIAFAKDPRDTTVRVGDTASFRVALTDSAGASLQWYRDGVAVSGATFSQYRLAPARLRDHGARLTCKATTPAGGITSAAAVARVEFPTPTLSPAASEVIDTVRVTATSYHADAKIFMSIDGAAFKEVRSVVIRASATVRACHAIFGDTSTSAVQAYTKVTLKPALLPGEKQVLPGGLALTNPAGAAGGVEVQLSTTPLSTPGFRDIASIFTLAPAAGSTATPDLSFSLDSSAGAALYHVRAGGGIMPLPAGSRLTEAGLYFAGVDTAAPVVDGVREEFLPGDSTRITLSLKDNTTAVNVVIEGVAGTSTRNGAVVASGGSMVAVFKNGSPCLGPLSIRLKVSDLRNTTAFPSTEGASHPLPQRASGALCTPDLFASTLDPEEPWELFSVPLSAETPVTFSALRDRNPGSGLVARSWTAENGYVPMDPGAGFLPGHGYWLGSAGGRKASLSIPPHTSRPATDPEGRKLSLHSGWNLVGNPSLSTLYWPVSHAGTLRWDLSPLKVPHAYETGSGSWIRSDSLPPWRGYFVYNNGGDTVVTLLAKPLPALPAKRAASASGASIALGIRGVTLRLGATPEALDGPGPEDEAAPPRVSRRGSLLFAHAPKPAEDAQTPRTSGTALAADFRRWNPGAVLSWSAVATAPAVPQPGAAPVDSLRVLALDLPDGHGAFVLFRSSGRRAPLRVGASFPLLPGFSDSLTLLAGPAALLAKRIDALPALPPRFVASARGTRNGFALDLALAMPGRLAFTLHGLDGRQVTRETVQLPAGLHRLDRHLPAVSASRGLLLLRMEFRPASPDASPVTEVFRILPP